jgi:hypothetical protein
VSWLDAQDLILSHLDMTFSEKFLKGFVISP